MPQVAQPVASARPVAHRLPDRPADDASLPRSARSKIVRVIFRLSVTLAAVLVVSVTAVVLLQHELAKIDDQIIPAMTLNLEIRNDMADSRTALQRDVLVADPTAPAHFQAAQDRLARRWVELEPLLSRDPALVQSARDEHDLQATWINDHAAPIMAATAAGRSVSPTTQVAAETAYEKFRIANTDLGSILRARHQALVSRSIMVLWVALAIAVVVIIGGTAWTVQPAVRALRWIGPPLEDLHATVRRLQQGDPSARADPTKGVLEIRAVSAAVNRLASAHQRQLEQGAEEIRLSEAVREIGSIVGSTFDLDRILADSTAPIITNFAAAGVWTRAFEASAEAQPDEAGSVFPLRTSPQQLVSRARQAAELAWRRQSYFIIRRQGPNDPSYLAEDDAQAILDIPDLDGADSILFVPLGGGPTCVGYIGLRRLPEQPEWTEREISALLRVGGDLGRAILHARLYAKERQLVTQLKELDSAKTDFVSMVSHELRTPLASIIGHLEIVQGGDVGPIDDETRPFLSAIDRNATRLNSLIEDLLLLSRIEQRAAKTNAVRLDLAEMVTGVVSMYAETAARKNITIVLESVDDAPVLGNPTELEQVVTNLLGNAIKYSPSGTTVWMSLTTGATPAEGAVPGRPELILTVRDQGPGIAAADQPKIFERFFRAGNAATQSIPGTGLGLAITQLVAERHGGTVSVESTLGQGSTFAVRLPAELPAEQPSLVPAGG